MITELNKKLKFSWGHIIAFLALIYICYLTFMGITYLTNGNMTIALIGMGVVGLLQLIFFIGPQLLKGTDSKFDRCILWERILLLSAPFVFIATMMPSSHFWTVHNKNDEFVKEFQNAVSASRQLFVDYDAYATTRIDSLKLATARDSASSKYEVEGLQLQLESKNYKDLKANANEWIDKAENGATTWNVFLLGNIDQIKSALLEWQDQLNTWSEHQTKHENKEFATNFKTQSNSIKKATRKLDGLKKFYADFKFPNVWAFLNMIICALLMLFPYFLQDRDGKARGIYSLFHKKHKRMSFQEAAPAGSNNQSWGDLSGLSEDLEKNNKGKSSTPNQDDLSGLGSWNF